MIKSVARILYWVCAAGVAIGALSIVHYASYLVLIDVVKTPSELNIGAALAIWTLTLIADVIFFGLVGGMFFEQESK